MASHRFTVRGLLAAASLLVCCGTAHAESAEEVERCMRANAPQRTMVQEADLTSFDRSGEARTQTAKIYWKRSAEGRSRFYVRVEAPPDLRGSAFLLLEQDERNDLFMYLPELRKIRRITPRTVSGSLFGSDFSYEDIERVQGLAKSTGAQRLPDDEVDGRGVYAVVSTPDPESGSAYGRIVSFVDRETCVPLRIEFFEPSGELRKRFTADPEKIAKTGDSWVPHRLTIKDLRRETESRLEIRKVAIDVDVPDRYFTEGQLLRRH